MLDDKVWQVLAETPAPEALAAIQEAADALDNPDSTIRNINAFFIVSTQITQPLLVSFSTDVCAQSTLVQSSQVHLSLFFTHPRAWQLRGSSRCQPPPVFGCQSGLPGSRLPPAIALSVSCIAVHGERSTMLLPLVSTADVNTE